MAPVVEPQLYTNRREMLFIVQPLEDIETSHAYLPRTPGILNHNVPD